MSDRRTMSIEDFVDSGLLFEINRRVLHPLGLALSFVNDPEADSAFKFGGIWDSRHDPEGMAFDDESFADGMDKLKRYMRQRGQAALDHRKRALGFVEQAGPLPEESQ